MAEFRGFINLRTIKGDSMFRRKIGTGAFYDLRQLRSLSGQCVTSRFIIASEEHRYCNVMYAEARGRCEINGIIGLRLLYFFYCARAHTCALLYLRSWSRLNPDVNRGKTYSQSSTLRRYFHLPRSFSK